jgi:hypothetical protein
LQQEREGVIRNSTAGTGQPQRNISLHLCFVNGPGAITKNCNAG